MPDPSLESAERVTQSHPDSEAALLDYMSQWKFNSPVRPRQLLPKSSFDGPADRSYNLNRLVRLLQFEQQAVGLDLGWTPNGRASSGTKAAHWFGARRSRKDHPLIYGETLALGVGETPSFLRYAKRPFGPQLTWSARPVYEWKLVGSMPGDAILPGRYLAIYNENSEQHRISFDRSLDGPIALFDPKEFVSLCPRAYEA